MAKRNCHMIILAAGEGSRMKSRTPKVMHQLAGAPMVTHILRTAKRAGACKLDVVVGPNMKELASLTISTVHGTGIHVQEERLGTAHAVLAARPSLEKKSDEVIILYGDTPLISGHTISRLRDVIAAGADVAVLGFYTAKPEGYGRLLTGDNDKLLAIREHADASQAEREITFCNSGVMAFNGEKILGLLDKIGNDNPKGEFYLTDAVEIANGDGLNVVAIEGEEAEILGINSPAQLAEVEAIIQGKLRRRALENGTRMVAPETVYLSYDTELGSDVSIEPNVFFGPNVKVADGVTIKAFSHLEGATIEEFAVVGPFARLRPGAHIGNSAHIGNFVEVKNSDVQRGAKVGHLTYLGDATVGTQANIGAGTITCNYDGHLKHRTRIGENAFIGSNSSLVAPVTIGDGAYVGSGSVITRDVEPDALVVERGEQTIKSGWAAQQRARMAVTDETGE